MNKIFKIAIIWTPVVLVFGQLFANFFYLADPTTYGKWYFMIATFFGTNLLASFLMMAVTFYFKFCSISRACAVAQVIFCVTYLLIPTKDDYNLALQMILGVAAILFTIITIIKDDKVWTQEPSQH